MAIKFKGRNGPFARVQVDLGGLFGRMAKEAVRGPLGEKAGRFAERAARHVYEAFNAEPEEPFVELQQVCPFCNVQIYASANGIKLCLMCQRRFGMAPGIAHGMGGFAPGARPDIPWTTPRATPRTPPGARHGQPRKVRDPFQEAAKQHGFKVRRKAVRPAAPPPPREPTQDELIHNAYVILGLASDATTDDVARRRRQMARDGNHPDQGGSDARMAEINAAADLLIAHLG